MRWLQFGILLLVLMLLQASFVHTLAFGGGRIQPNLLLIFLVYVALYAEPYELIIASFIVGMGADIVYANMGPFTISYGVFGSLLGELRRYLVVEKILHQMLIIGLTGLFTLLLSNLLAFIKGANGPNLSWWGSTLYSSLIGPLLFPLLHLWIRPNPTRRRAGIHS